MQRSELTAAVQPAAVVRRVAEQAPLLRQHGGHHAHTPPETVRETTYRGHRIVVRTSYRLEVDGVELKGHMGVTADGQVHYHAVPNLGFASAVDLVKELIDVFPDDFPEPGAEHPPEHPHEHAHPHEHGHPRVHDGGV